MKSQIGSVTGDIYSNYKLCLELPLWKCFLVLLSWCPPLFYDYSVPAVCIVLLKPEISQDHISLKKKKKRKERITQAGKGELKPLLHWAAQIHWGCSSGHASLCSLLILQKRGEKIILHSRCCQTQATSGRNGTMSRRACGNSLWRNSYVQSFVSADAVSMHSISDPVATAVVWGRCLWVCWCPVRCFMGMLMLWEVFHGYLNAFSPRSWGKHWQWHVYQCIEPNNGTLCVSTGFWGEWWAAVPWQGGLNLGLYTWATLLSGWLAWAPL